MVKEDNGEDGAEDADGEHDADGFEYPEWVDELDHLVWLRGAVAAAGVEAGLEAGCLRLGHGATVVCLASHAGSVDVSARRM